jgi:hypothetical protein
LAAIAARGLDAAHEDHDEGCDCYYRLSDGLDGVYRFPERSHGPPRAPVYGCKTPIQAACDRISKGMIESMYRSLDAQLKYGGLAGALAPQAPNKPSGAP